MFITPSMARLPRAVSQGVNKEANSGKGSKTSNFGRYSLCCESSSWKFNLQALASEVDQGDQQRFRYVSITSKGVTTDTFPHENSAAKADQYSLHLKTTA